MTDLPPAAWYPDPEVPGQQRYWDGHRWTEHRVPVYTPGGTAAMVRGGGMPDVGEFLSRCGRATVGSLRPMAIPIAVVLGAMLVALVAFLAASPLDDWLSEVIDIAFETPAGVDPVFPDAPDLGADLGLLAIFAVVTIVGSAYLAVAWLFPMADVLEGRTPRLPPTGTVVRAAGRLIGLFLLAALAMIAVVGVLAVVGFAIGPFVALLILGVIPVAVWVAIRLSLALPIAVLDGLGLDAIGGSWRATQGRWWALFGRLALFALIFGVATQVVGFPLQIASSVSASLLIPFSFLSMALQVVATPVSYVSSVVLHHALVAAVPEHAEGRR